MGELVYQALENYFNILGKTGYVRFADAEKVLLLSFYKDFLDNTLITDKCDYQCIDRALNCLYGSSCLIPYPDYLTKMSEVNTSAISEIAARVAALEQTNVLKAIHNSEEPEDSDIRIIMKEG